MVHIGATTAVEGPDGSVRLERRVVGSASLASMGVEGISYVHSIAVSENFVVLPLYPLKLNLEKVLYIYIYLYKCIYLSIYLSISYVHSIVVSKNFVVLPLYPLKLNLEKVIYLYLYIYISI